MSTHGRNSSNRTAIADTPATSGAASRLQDQLRFIVEVDRLKHVLRRTSPIGAARRENSAEHSWQVVLMAVLLHEHANESIDLLKVVRMLAIHDVVEVDVGDTFHYDNSGRDDLAELEARAAERLFGMLPADQATELASLWREFEAKESPEAKFASAVDRFVAFIMNSHNDGGTWVKHGVTASQILALNSHIGSGSAPLWDAAQRIVSDALESGRIKP